MTTETIFPLHVTPNTKIININTRAVCPHITTNCVTTCEKRISPGDTPATQDRSSNPYEKEKKYEFFAYFEQNLVHSTYLCSFNDQCRRCQRYRQKENNSKSENLNLNKF